MRTINCSLTVGSSRDRGCRAGWFTGSLASKWLVLFSVALLAVVMTAVPASAQTCLQNEYNEVQRQKLNCTANDVRIAKVTNIRDPQTGQTLSQCFQGSTFSFIADFEILTTSSQARENIGLYIQTDPTKPDALFGSCVDNIISPQHQCAGVAGGPAIQCGSDNYHSTDPAPDNCGDTASGDFSGTFGAGAEKVTLQIDNFLCQAPAGSSTLVLPNCTSWQIPGGTIQCVSPSPSFPYPLNGPGGTPTAIPGSPSKCNCSIISLPITPVTVAPIVQKACTTGTSTPNPPTFTQNPNVASPTSCSAGAEGSTVTYTVAITNTSAVSGNNVVVDQICDDKYGTVFTANGFTGAPCAAGTVGTASNLTCPPAPIASGATGTCTFSAVQGENGSVTDTVSASGHSSLNPSSTFTKTQSNSVNVTSTDAASTATVTKGVTATEAACATVRYGVDVKNTSGADETLSLSALSDSFYGDITKCTNANCANLSGAAGSAQVLGTTCGVASGIGTLVGTTGAGAFSPSATIAPGGHYICAFDGQFCSGLDNNSCISNTDKVTGTLTGDESEAVTQTATTVTVKECSTQTVTVSPLQ
jgi:uncharacterized repeat protein (TIGR01451 family)